MSLNVSDNININSNSASFDEREEMLKKEEFNKNKSAYKSFIQVNREYAYAEDWLVSESPLAWRIFRFFIECSDNYNNVRAIVCPSKVLEFVFNKSRVTISRALKVLSSNKFIGVYKSGNTNVYAINSNIVWKSYGSNHKFAKFTATILLEESEQVEIMRKVIKASSRTYISIKSIEKEIVSKRKLKNK